MRKIFIFLALSVVSFCVNPARGDEATRAVQEELRRRHLFYGDIDGRETPNLIEALRRYQERKGFPPTGVADEATLRSMGVRSGSDDEPATLPDVPILRSDRGLGIGGHEPAPAGAAAPQAGATAAPAPSEEGIRTFVRRYLEACRGRDIEDEVAFYADQVDYFHHGTVDKNRIRTELNAYVQQWPARIYHLSDQLAVEQNGDKTIVRCRINFDLEHAMRNRRASGQADTTFTLARRGDGWEIVGHQEERVRSGGGGKSSGKRKSKSNSKSKMTPLDRTLNKFFGGGSRPPSAAKQRSR